MLLSIIKMTERWIISTIRKLFEIQSPQISLLNFLVSIFFEIIKMLFIYYI